MNEQNFIETISNIHFNHFWRHFEKIKNEKVSCALFFGLNPPPDNLCGVCNIIRVLKNSGLDISYVFVLDDVQGKDPIFKDCPVPIVELENIHKLHDKPKAVFMSGMKDSLFVSFFEQYHMDSYLCSLFEFFNDTKNLLAYLDVIMENLPKLYQTYNWLGDDESKETFLCVLKGNLTGKFGNYRYAKEPQYFLEGFLPGEGDIAIDGGAFDGATARDFSKLGAKVYAFEMDELNYKNCLPLAEKFGFVIENYGLSDKISIEEYAVCASGSFKISAQNGNQSNGVAKKESRFVDLDTYCKMKKLPRVDYIKLDIEGSELDMLHGAVNTIKNFRPKMAISTYHKIEDLYTLPQFIKSIREDYQFEFRHYKIDCTDYFLNDTERELVKYFGLEIFAPTIWEHCLYCK